MTAGILDPSPALSGAELTPEEQALVARVDGQNDSASTLAQVSLILAAAFGVYRLYMRRRLSQQMKEAEPSTMLLVAGATYQAFVPKWVSMVAPALVTGYLEGMGETRHNQVPEDYLQDIATSYAIQLGDHLNDVSMEALVNGYQAQLNRKVPLRRALENVISAYGVPNRTMNALIKIWTGEDTKVLSTRPAKNRRDAKAASVIDKAFGNRAKQMSDTEAWTARSQAKQLMWMWGIEKGTIPPTATRVWRTARDERVCPACGPLDKAEVRVDQPFITDMGEFWSPPLHPKCRCDIHLAVDIVGTLKSIHDEQMVGKALGGDPFDRDRRGRFARIEARLAPATARPDFEPQKEETTEELWERVRAQRAASREQKTKGKELDLTPIELGISLEGINLTPIELKGGDPEQAKPQTALPQVTLRAGMLPQATIQLDLGKLQLPSFVDLSEPEPAATPPPMPDHRQGLYRLDVPVYGLVNSSEVKEDVLTGADQPVFQKEEVDQAIKEYWEEIVTHDIQMTFQYGTDDEWLHLEHAARPDRVYYIDKDTYSEVWAELLQEGRDGLYSTYNVPMGNMETGIEETVEMAAYDIANLSGMIDYVEENKPMVFRMDWGWVGESDTAPESRTASRTNPGKWQIQNHRAENTELSNRPYLRVTTTPI